MKKLLALLLALLMVFSIIGCAKEEAPSDDTADAPAADDTPDEPAEAPADGEGDAASEVELLDWEKEYADDYTLSGEDEYTIAWISLAFTDKFNTRAREAAKAYAAENYPNVTFLEGDGEADANIQIGLVENYLAQGIDSLCFVAVDSYACGSVVCDMCEEAGVPLILPIGNIECGKENCKLHTFVGSDHFYSGQLQAEYIIENVDDAETVKVFYLEGTNGFSHTTQRKAGLFDTLDAQGYNYELVSSLEADYTRDLGLSISEDWFTKYGEEIQVIAAANDEMAWGALEAMKGAGYSGVTICGIDCNDDTKVAIQDGEIAMSVFQNGEMQGKWSMIAAYSALKGTEHRDIIVPYEKVTVDNVADYM